MSGLFGGGKVENTDGGANDYARLMAGQASEQAKRAQENATAVQTQLENQRKQDETDKAAELKKQQDQVTSLEAEQQAKNAAAAQQNQAQNVTGGAGLDMNNLNKGAMALANQKAGISASEKQSNLDRIKNQQIYGAQGFNFGQQGGQRMYK
jgi:hypothetical protein